MPVCQITNKVSTIKPKHVQGHLKFVKKYEFESDEFWKKVIWLDETKIEHLGRNMCTQVWRGKGTEYNPVNTIPTIKYGGGSVMICGCFSYNEVGEIEVIE